MRLLSISFFIVVIDQLSKLFVKGFSIPFLDFYVPGMYYGQRIHVIGNFFNITFVENPGIAFGINFGSDFKLLISLFTVAATAGLIIYFYLIKKKEFSLRLSVAIIIGGALGNLIDRVFYGLFYGYAPLFYGKVVDFFDFRIFSFYSFHNSFGNYIFNFADIAVTVGVFMLLLNLHRKPSENRQPKPSLEKCLVENKD